MTPTLSDHVRQRAQAWAAQHGISGADIDAAYEEVWGVFSATKDALIDDDVRGIEPMITDRVERPVALELLRSAANLFPGDIAGDLMDYGESALPPGTFKNPATGQAYGEPPTMAQVETACWMIFAAALPEGPPPPD